MSRSAERDGTHRLVVRAGAEPGLAVSDPAGSPPGTKRVMRGGSWRVSSGGARSTARNLEVLDLASGNEATSWRVKVVVLRTRMARP